MNSEMDSLRFLNIDINGSSIAELEENQRIIEVPIHEVQEIYYKFGCAAERPMVNIILGTFFICLGLCVVPFIYSWFTEGGTLHELHLAFLVSAIIGGWLISTVTISKLHNFWFS